MISDIGKLTSTMKSIKEYNAVPPIFLPSKSRITLNTRGHSNAICFSNAIIITLRAEEQMNSI